MLGPAEPQEAAAVIAAVEQFLADTAPAGSSPFLPADPWQRAQALAWMFFEQYSHEPYLAVARFICGWTPIDSPRRADLPRLRERSRQALAVMERHLSQRAWFTGDDYGIADIALYGYAHSAEEGGFAIAAQSAVEAWRRRVREQPRHIAI